MLPEQTSALCEFNGCYYEQLSHRESKLKTEVLRLRRALEGIANEDDCVPANALRHVAAQALVISPRAAS